MPYEMERETALAAVISACQLCQAVAQHLIAEDTIEKKDRSPVTVADFGAQAVVSRLLARAFPQDRLIGEEDAAVLRQDAPLREKVCTQVRAVSATEGLLGEEEILAAIDRGGFAGGAPGRAWTLDPIDGTKGFLRREQYAVALALIEDGKLVLGVLGCPNLPWQVAVEGGPSGCLFVAVRGQGAFVRRIEPSAEVSIRVSAAAQPADAVRCESVEAAHSAHDVAHLVAERLGMTRPPVRMDSQAKYGAVARGEAGVYMRLPTRQGYQEKIWDHAAGAILVEEAGGRVTDIDGHPLDFSLGRTLAQNRGILASNGKVHNAVLAAIAEAYREA